MILDLRDLRAVLTHPAAVPIAFLAVITWRRMFGGWLGLRRTLLHGVLFLANVAAVLVTLGRIDLGIVVAVLVLATWADGHEWTWPKFMFYRYSLGPTAAAGVLAWGTGRPEAALLALAGAAVAATYSIGRRNGGGLSPGGRAD